MNKHFLLLLFPALTPAVHFQEEGDPPAGCTGRCKVAVTASQETDCIHCCEMPACNVDVDPTIKTPEAALGFYLKLAGEAQAAIASSEMKAGFANKLPNVDTTFMDPGTKSHESALDKVLNRVGGQARAMKDLARVSIIIHNKKDFTLENSQALIEVMKDAKFSVVGAVRNRGMFEESVKLPADWIYKQTSGGYVDVQGVFMFDNKIQSEVQFILCHVWNYKIGDGHKFYEEMRTILGMKNEKDLVGDDEKKYTDLSKKAEVGYTAAKNNDAACTPQQFGHSLMEGADFDAFLDYLYA